MRRLSWFAMPFAFWLAANAAAMPIAEKWEATRNAYDIHACGTDRFVLGERAGQSYGAVAKFTVLPGDACLKTTGERSEVVLGGWRSSSRFQVKGDEGMEFYRISVKLTPDWIAPERNVRGYVWGIFFQLHGPNEYGSSPAVAMYAEDKFSLFVLGGDMNKKLGGKRFLTRSDLNTGKWVEFILKIKWAPDSTGSIAVFRRDEGETDWEKVADIGSVATLQFRGSEAPGPHYWKAGIYRSESKHVNSLWLGPILRGKTFEEVTAR